MHGEWQFIIERGDYDRRWRVFGAAIHADGSVAELSPTEVTLRQPGELAQHTAFVNMPREMARPMLQALVDAAWREGIRPSELEDWKAKTNGTAAHLADMRAIVAKQLDVKL